MRTQADPMRALRSLEAEPSEVVAELPVTMAIPPLKARLAQLGLAGPDAALVAVLFCCAYQHGFAAGQQQTQNSEDS